MALNQDILMDINVNGYSKAYRRRIARSPVYLMVRDALAVLRRFGQDAHIYLPGVGMMNGLQAGNYLHTDGVTKSAVDDPVGLVLDAAGGVGVELVTNGGFADATGWTVPAGWSVGSGVATATATSSSILCTQYTPVSGKTYLLTFDCIVTGGTLYVSTGSGSAASFTTSGSKSCVLVCGATPSRAVEWYGGAFSGPINNISVREVTGIAASQPTPASKPILRRGAVNLLTQSQALDDALWIKSATAVTPNAAAAPDGSITADRLTESATTSAHQWYKNSNLSAGVFTVSFYAKASERDTIQLEQETGGNSRFVLTGAGTATALGANSVGITALLDGWYRCSSSFTTTGPWQTYFGIYAGAMAYLGDVSKGLLFWGAQIEVGTKMSMYAPTTTAPASTALGPYWLDTAGSKSLVATYPAGNESVTVIDAGYSTTTTLTAQNVVGAYNINADTSGRIIINGALSAADLTLLQTFATRLAGR